MPRNTKTAFKGVKTIAKEQANVGDLIDLLVSIRNSIDEFVNKAGIEALAPKVPRFTAEDYNKLPWTKGFSQKRPTWEKCVMCPMENKDLEAIRDDLVKCCMADDKGNEATIRAPMLAYDWGYWIYKSDYGESIYRRPMKKP